jgi:pyruvate/2-oxoglutarate dehydrogenase complex dihydrolipoamide dehydrogenase (E3) component
VDIDKLRGHKEKVVGKLTGGLAAMAKMRKVTTVRGYGVFLDPYHVQVEETTGSSQDKTGTTKVVKFKNAIIAAGSQAVRLPFFPDDERIVDSDRRAGAASRCPRRCWSSAAASSAWKWARCTARWARASMWSKCSTA